jgi:hypothetical protein
MATQYETIAEAQEELKEEDRQLLLWTALGISYAIDVFATRIDGEITRFRNANISDDEIGRILGDDLRIGGRVFGELANTIKRGIVSGIMQGARLGQDSVYGNNINFKWVSVGSKRICKDCKDRIGRIETWDVWEKLGLPATGFSVCKEYCYCQLIPSNIDIDDRIIL